MIRFAMISAALGLAGCASYSDMQASAPAFEFDTSRTAASYAGCLMPKANDLWRNMVTIAPDGESQVVTVQTAMGVVSMTTVTPTAAGAHVVHRARAGSRDPDNAWSSLLRECQ